MKTYTSYTRPRITWINAIPSHWNTERAKWLFTRMERPVRENDDVITCFRDGIVTLRKNRRELGFTESLQEIGYQGIRRGDLVIHAMDAFAGAIGVADSDGKGTPVYSVCKPSPRSNAYYYAHLLREMARNNWILALAKGIRQRSVDFRYSEFGNQFVPVPPLDEQTAIVRYLDNASDPIRRAISAKERLIELLTEQRQAVIHRAVTCGLDLNVPVKDSSVEWLGDVPEHWEVASLRHRYAQSLGKMLDSKRYTGIHSLPYIRNIDVQWDHINITNLPTMDISPDEYDRYTVQPGDLLVCEGGEVGRSAIWSEGLKRYGFQKALHRLRPLNVQHDMPRFLFYALRAAERANAFNDGQLSTISHLTGEKLRSHRFPFPPLSEQTSIARYLDKTTADIDTAIDKAQRQIDLLREYRTRLIADVVTGQVDVRGAVGDEVELPVS